MTFTLGQGHDITHPLIIDKKQANYHRIQDAHKKLYSLNITFCFMRIVTLTFNIWPCDQEYLISDKSRKINVHQAVVEQRLNIINRTQFIVFPWPLTHGHVEVSSYWQKK